MSSEFRRELNLRGSTGRRRTLLALMFLATAPLVAVAEERGVEIVFTGIQCYKTTSGPGDDQPYAAMVAIDLRSAKVAFNSHQFGDIGEDEMHDTNIVVGDFSPLKRVDDFVMLVAFAEHDRGSTTDFDGGGLRHAGMAAEAAKKITAIAKKYQAHYSANIQWRPQVVAEMETAFNDTCRAKLDQDDLIGIEMVRLQAEDVSGPKNRSVERRVIMRGDGGAYTLYFNIKSRDAMLGISPPGDGLTIPGVPVLPTLSGKWNSTLGPTELTQNGNVVTGTVKFPNQVVGKINGKINGQTLDCQWFVHAGHHGTVKLNIDNDGKTLSGNYQSALDPTFKGFWKLTRAAASQPAIPPNVPNLVGNWQQIAGTTSLPKATVIIGQQTTQPTEFACRIPEMKLFGKGQISANNNVTASFGAANADASDFGPGGVFQKVSGKITEIDANGRAMRIEWDNGVVYQRK